MESRRDFFKHAAALAGGAGATATLLASIERASAIQAPQDSTFLDAEHVVILMQENRSFDHAYGRLRGVRGFNDPRAVTLPNQNPVWLQTNAAGETYAPFRLDLRNSKATWLGSLPHSWRDQTEARNHGNHDRWLDSKPSHHEGCAGMPLTLGYYDREDIPFYYALADAFTICDQHFCSSLTGTTPNRLYLWTGTLREKQEATSVPNVRNSEVVYGSPANWKTFPERLEEAGVSWKIYQNELSWPTGMNEEEDSWLANFTDNPIEWFEQYHSGYLKTHLDYLERQAMDLPGQITQLEAEKKHSKELAAKKLLLQKVTADCARWSSDGFSKLNSHAQNLHAKAFTTNAGDLSYRQLATLKYTSAGTQREFNVPKGDVLHQFRQDVQTGKLPAVSWLVASEKFSDHPGAPWYGAWYVAEALDILTKNPDLWKKTIFILTYDENDGYFDHVPPFVAPDPGNPETGKASEGIDTGLEYLHLEQDLKRAPSKDAAGGPIGLGFRVPLVIASPWSRGGFVCSQVFDHTSVLQLLERVMQKQAKGKLEETNISTWRRTVCGDLTAAFHPASAEKALSLKFPGKDVFLESVHQAQFKPMPAGFRKLSPEDLQLVKHGTPVAWMPSQEPGVRPSCALPYEIYAEGAVTPDRKFLNLTLSAGNSIFGASSAGIPFHVYTQGPYRGRTELRTRAYATAAGGRVQDTWEIEGFANGLYQLRVCGPNGFLHELAGDAHDPSIAVHCEYLRDGNIQVNVTNGSTSACTFQVKDHAYKSGDHSFTVGAGLKRKLVLDLHRSFSWYDFSVTTAASRNYVRRYAGRVETGKAGVSDPAMGRVKI